MLYRKAPITVLENRHFRCKWMRTLALIRGKPIREKITILLEKLIKSPCKLLVLPLILANHSVQKTVWANRTRLILSCCWGRVHRLSLLLQCCYSLGQEQGTPLGVRNHITFLTSNHFLVLQSAAERHSKCCWGIRIIAIVFRLAVMTFVKITNAAQSLNA